MIPSASKALGFANSLATSFVTLGTTVGGWIIATHGVEIAPMDGSYIWCCPLA